AAEPPLARRGRGPDPHVLHERGLPRGDGRVPEQTTTAMEGEVSMGKFIELKAADGHHLNAYVAEPSGKPRGAIVVVQEIFGVNSHIRSVADGFAADGYLAIAPALFDRAQRNFESGYSQEDVAAGRAVREKISWDQAVHDVAAARDHVRHAGK